MSRRRNLSDEERSLWKSFTRSIKPFRTSPSAPEPDEKPAKPTKRTQALPEHAAPRRAVPLPALPPPLAPLDRRFKQRVARGRESIEARIDLHGMTQTEAHAALVRFLHRAQADGARTVLVVTGKGSLRQARSSEGGAERDRGVLRRQVPMWLALPEFRPLVVGFDNAHVGHGGQGALYVRLRRGR